jgi:hypothetical protein
MGALGEDIKNAYIDVGTKISINKLNGVSVAQEYIDYDVNIRSSNPFHREFFLESVFPYDSKAEAGDIVEFVATGDKYIIASRTPEIFENEVMEFDNVLYRCNVSGELLRPRVQIDAQQELTENAFETIHSGCYGLLTESNYDNEWRTNQPFSDYPIRELFLYVPETYGVREEDRYSPVSGEYYRVSILKRRVFAAVDVAVLHEDNR